MLTMNFCYVFLIAIILQTQRADSFLELFGNIYFREVGQQSLIELFDVGFEISEYEDEIFTPKHHIVTPDVVHKT